LHVDCNQSYGSEIWPGIVVVRKILHGHVL
jgi:hypothetical protein